MERRIINPTKFAQYFADNFNTSAAFELIRPERLLICAGQPSVDADGAVVAVGDMKGQIERAMTNVENLLVASGYEPRHIVRMTVYVTDIDKMTENTETLVGILRNWNVAPPGVLCECSRLGDPDWMIEIEVMAAR